jgi:hypothetical protein
MTESKFIKGPWRVLGARDIPNSKRIASADLCLAVVSSPLLKPEEIEAIANLMAEAPRMLEVLRTLHDFALPLRDRELAAESEQAFADARAVLERLGG